ncbi:MAG: glycogen debranching enzyme N-terminal domain-containing protein [Deltaproteobacteria bacterium]|nr:glycogen debranching enzyme N-terminal domain-containing protein [Deltaproteobacteria bacterium]
MAVNMIVEQQPVPGTHLLRFRGDVLRFSLTVPQKTTGAAWVRTNLGHGGRIRSEIIESVEKDLPPLGKDWFNIPMKAQSGHGFSVTLPLCEVGHFEAKCFFIPEGSKEPLWPKGPNTVINVEPAHTCCANLIYNAFIRQFGGTMATADPQLESRMVTEIARLDRAGYAVIPPSGTFRDLIDKLDFIFNTLGCRIIQLLPIHPTPTTYARMGRFGSPYAALSFTAVDPALARFDPHATPLEQFIELVDAVHMRHGKLLLDIAINHTGWGAALHETHPQWLSREPDGRIEVPGAWGVLWQDLTKLDYAHRDLWQYMANMFLTWCRRGVDGFRCDAGYMIPTAAWAYITAIVREQYPDTIFFLEGLGGKISVTREILNIGNFNWAYSELFQNYHRGQVEWYLPQAHEIAAGEGIMVHFAETHDNQRLAARSTAHARLRTRLCALFAPYGAFGFTNGVEWYATEKINVHQASSLNWGAGENQIDIIAQLTTLLKQHPAFHDRTELDLVQTGEGNHVALVRYHRPTGKKLLILANLDETDATRAAWRRSAFDPESEPLVDLLTGERLNPLAVGDDPACLLEPAQIRCLSTDPADLAHVEKRVSTIGGMVPRIIDQQLRAKVFEVLCVDGHPDVGSFDVVAETRALQRDPVAFCRHQNCSSPEPRVVVWQWPEDQNREVMVPPDHLLLVRAPAAFRARIAAGNHNLRQEESLPAEDGTWFALFCPLPATATSSYRELLISLFLRDGPRHATARLYFPVATDSLDIPVTYHRSDLLSNPRMFLSTNGRGAMTRMPVVWGMLESRYDALLAANCHSEFPVNRWIMLTRCRAWIVFQDYSQEIRFDCFHTFTMGDDQTGLWRFHVPCGQGEHLRLTVGVALVPAENRVRLFFYRHSTHDYPNRLADDRAIRLIIRPDLENRSFHESTKAYTGPETDWIQAVTCQANGFRFTPDPNHHLTVRMPHGRFEWEPQWQYMVHRPREAQRGLDPDSDLFSPGYFTEELLGGQAATVFASVTTDAEPNFKQDDLKFVTITEEQLHKASAPLTLEQAARRALDQFIIHRGSFKTVIAGYPWFLDWGRDTLIVLRGLVAAGRLTNVRAILHQYGQFEDSGTMPNMIHGQNLSNRDTADAPLWFIVACSDLMDRERSRDFLDTTTGGRTIGQIVRSIVESYINGTPGGVKMDEASGLIYSPAHYTWMDTNHPAGTPRQGYPIEIQALWSFALSFMVGIDPSPRHGNWHDLSQTVQSSIRSLYGIDQLGYLVDCRHADSGQSASDAEPDDALRPNQLLAITLGAITDLELCRKILSACETLLVPGAIRSLADRPVKRPLPIRHGGNLLNDPIRPYQGEYIGDEDTRRKPAYHNGTAWTWLYPSYCEAWARTYGPDAVQTAKAWLGASQRLFTEGCVGQIPEILDGNTPHRQRGCDAQAWGVSELLRVWLLLNDKKQLILH